MWWQVNRQLQNSSWYHERSAHRSTEAEVEYFMWPGRVCTDFLEKGIPQGSPGKEVVGGEGTKRQGRNLGHRNIKRHGHEGSS